MENSEFIANLKVVAKVMSDQLESVANELSQEGARPDLVERVLKVSRALEEIHSGIEGLLELHRMRVVVGAPEGSGGAHA